MSVAAIFDQRRDPGLAASALLAAAVHVLLALMLLVGVRWQNRPPETVEVELWSEPPALERPEPPKPVVEPPRVEPPKPEPRIEKPDIAIKEPPKPKPKPEAKPKPKPKPEPRAQMKPEPERAKPRDEEAQKRLHEELAREQASFTAERERQAIKDQLTRDAAAARTKAMAEWVDKVRAKIRSNIVLPQDIKGNPEAIFDVVQLPTGEVLQATLRKSSGHKPLDEAIERAIIKSSPLPKPARPELFTRSFELKYRPLD